MRGRRPSKGVSTITNNQFIDVIRGKGLTRTRPGADVCKTHDKDKKIGKEKTKNLNISQKDKIIKESVIVKYGDESGTEV